MRRPTETGTGGARRADRGQNEGSVAELPSVIDLMAALERSFAQETSAKGGSVNREQCKQRSAHQGATRSAPARFCP